MPSLSGQGAKPTSTSSRVSDGVSALGKAVGLPSLIRNGSVSSVGRGGENGEHGEEEEEMTGTEGKGNAVGASITPSRKQREDIQLMKKRAMTNVTFKYVRLGEVNVFLSYKGGKWANLEDFDSLHLKLHSYVVSNQTSTVEELLVQMRNNAIIDVLSQGAPFEIEYT